MTDEEFQGTWEYKGWAIRVSARGWFISKDPNGPSDNTRDVWDTTLEGLEKKIDAIENKRTKQKAAPLKIPVVTSEGKTGIVTGLNIRTGYPLGIPDHDGYGSATAYPDVPWIHEQLRELKRLRALTEPLNKALKLVALERQYKVESTEEYTKAVDNFVADYTAKVLKAETMAEVETERVQETARRRQALEQRKA
jgi:hypothetical protein